MLKVALSAGHATNTPGKRSPDGEREWSFNNKVLLACAAKLSTYQNVQILRLDDPKGVRDVPLRERTNKANAWGADVLVDIHHNASAGKWGSHGGVETFVHPTGSRTSYALANVVQPLITKSMSLRNRGVKQKNLHMVRESNMPAILTEGGFMDSFTDIGALRSDAKLKAQGEAIAEGLAKYFKLKKKVSNLSGWAKSSDTWYFYENGRAKTGWLKVKNKWYYLNASGIMQTGWVQVSGKWYFLDNSGAMQTGWQKVDGEWYLLDNDGVMQIGWHKVKGKWYYMYPSGRMAADQKITIGKDGDMK